MISPPKYLPGDNVWIPLTKSNYRVEKVAFVKIESVILIKTSSREDWAYTFFGNIPQTHYLNYYGEKSMFVTYQDALTAREKWEQEEDERKAAQKLEMLATDASVAPAPVGLFSSLY